MSVIHNFPADGKYVFHIQPYAHPEGEVFGRTFGNEQMEVSIDGARVALMTVDRWMRESEPSGLNMRTDSIYVRAGPRRVTAAFLRRFEGEVDDLIRPIDHTLADGQIGIGYGVTTLPHLQRLTILGPYEVTGVSDTPTRRSVFSCRPTSPDEARPCAESIISRLGALAYRGPLDETDVSGLMDFYDRGAVDGGFEGGVRMALQAILASPHFLFRMEERPAGSSPGEVYRISDVDLASRLSFFIWGAPPDQELIDLADRGELSNPGELELQASRVLADPRAQEALATRFGAQWLRLQDLDEFHPDALSYPYFDDTLAESMRRETELLFSYLIRENRSVLELLTADYTFVNERLARHYGIPGMTGRIRDEGNPIDPVGELYDGTILRGPADLRAALLSRPEVFYRIFASNLMAYGLGRRVEYYDMPTVRAITRDAGENDYRFSSFVMGVVNSPAFQTARVEVEEQSTSAGL